MLGPLCLWNQAPSWKDDLPPTPSLILEPHPGPSLQPAMSYVGNTFSQSYGEVPTITPIL